MSSNLANSSYALIYFQRAKSVEASKFPDEFRPRLRMTSEGDEPVVANSEKARSKSVTLTATSEQRPPMSEGDAPKNDKYDRGCEEAEPLINGGLSAPSLVRSLASSSTPPSSEPHKVWRNMQCPTTPSCLFWLHSGTPWVSTILGFYFLWECGWFGILLNLI